VDTYTQQRTATPDRLLDDLPLWARRTVWIAISLGFEIGIATADLSQAAQAQIRASLERAHTSGAAPWLPRSACPSGQIVQPLLEVSDLISTRGLS